MWRVLVAVSGILLFLLYRNKVLHRTNSEVRAVNEKLRAAQEELKRLAITDRLTGLFNRAKLDEALEREFKRSRRYQSSFGVILLDIDFFKRVNDTHGYQTGDKILIAFAELLLTQIRESDLVGRWGGEEFRHAPNSNTS